MYLSSLIALRQEHLRRDPHSLLQLLISPHAHCYDLTFPQLDNGYDREHGIG
jgi:hypothetical protein